MAMLKPLGIEKGKPFKPDARQRAILEEAARIGDAMGRTMLFDGDQRISDANAFRGTHWNWVVLNRPDQETENYSQLDERLHYTYGAIYTSPGIGSKKAGPGSEYVQAFKDKDGNRLDGGKSYRLHVPAERAGRGLLVAHAVRHRDPLDGPERRATTPRARPTTSSRPTRTARSISTSARRRRRARRANWIETVPGKGFYPMFRFYTPEAGRVRRDVEAAGRRVDEMTARMRITTFAYALVAIIAAVAWTTAAAQPADPLPSWNAGKTKQSIVDFVARGHQAGTAVRAARRTNRHLRQRRHAVG